MGHCAVMCCGCRAMLSNDGQTIPAPADGWTHEKVLVGLVAEYAALRYGSYPSDVAWFASPTEADAAAAKAGWQTTDKLGANHRCPKCVVGKKTRSRGAYVFREATE